MRMRTFITILATLLLAGFAGTASVTPVRAHIYLCSPLEIAAGCTNEYIDSLAWCICYEDCERT